MKTFHIFQLLFVTFKILITDCINISYLLFFPYLLQDLSFSDFSLILMQETPILIAHGYADIVSSSQSIKLRKVIQAFQKYIGSHMYAMYVTDVFKRFLELHFSRSYNEHDKKPDLSKKYVCDAIKVRSSFSFFYGYHTCICFRFFFDNTWLISQNPYQNLVHLLMLKIGKIFTTHKYQDIYKCYHVIIATMKI